MSLQPGSNRLLPFGTGWRMLRVTGLMPIHDGQLKINRVPDPLQGIPPTDVMEIFNRDRRVMKVTRLTAVTTPDRTQIDQRYPWDADRRSPLIRAGIRASTEHKKGPTLPLHIPFSIYKSSFKH
ncbi:hypothetical protein D9M68_785920 [compost metagenome]